MKTHAGCVQGYNAQDVATKEQIIIAADVTQEENHVRQLHPMVDQARDGLTTARTGLRAMHQTQIDPVILFMDEINRMARKQITCFLA